MKGKLSIKRLEKGIKIIGELSEQKNDPKYNLPNLKGFTNYSNKLIIFLNWIGLGIIPPNFLIYITFFGVNLYFENYIPWWLGLISLILFFFLQYLIENGEDYALLQIGTEVELNNKFSFHPINQSSWYKIRESRVIFIDDYFLIFIKSIFFFRGYKKEKILENPYFDLRETNNIYVFSGLTFLEQIIPDRQIFFSEEKIKNLRKKIKPNSIFFVLQSNKRESYPVILSSSPRSFEDGYKFFKFLLYKLELISLEKMKLHFLDIEASQYYDDALVWGGNDTNHDKDYFQKLIEEGGIHISV
jgi:hypothetical protein